MDINKVASLARLKLSEEESKVFQKQLEDILKYAKNLSTINTDKVEPLVTPIEKETFFREDKVKSPLSSKEALQNAPQISENSFKTPSIKAHNV